MKNIKTLLSEAGPLTTESIRELASNLIFGQGLTVKEALKLVKHFLEEVNRFGPEGEENG